MAYLSVLTADGGIPLFTRKYGTVTELPFATLGALNGVHMFSKLRDAQLEKALTPDEKIIWRQYQERLVLILITHNDECSDCHLSNLTDNIFATIVMLVGLDTILKQSDPQKLKKELMVCYSAIDRLLGNMDPEEITIGDLTQRVDCIFATDIQNLQECLNEFLDTADSLYGCLMIKGKLVVASKNWWNLTNQEIVLICNYINSLPKATSREIPVYLPKSCPGKANRLVTLQLLRGVEISVLCSIDPPLAVLEENSSKIWCECLDLLKIVSNMSPRNFPNNIELDPNILGLILVNTDLKQSMCSLQPNESNILISKSERHAEYEKRQHSLRTLYRLVVGTYFPDESTLTDEKIRADNKTYNADCDNCNYENSESREYYMYLEENKCYAIKDPPHEIYIVYNNKIPHYAIRSVSQKSLKFLTEKKFFLQH